MDVCNILLRKSNTGPRKQKLQHHEENVFVKILFVFQPLLRKDNAIR